MRDKLHQLEEHHNILYAMYHYYAQHDLRGVLEPAWAAYCQVDKELCELRETLTKEER